jgi:hypothetical protein
MPTTTTDWPLRQAREAIRDAIDARHPETVTLEYVEGLDAREPMARALILAAGNECDEWLCPIAVKERAFGAAADRAYAGPAR